MGTKSSTIKKEILYGMEGFPKYITQDNNQGLPTKKISQNEKLQKIERSYSVANFKKIEKKKIPQYLKIFQKVNIFNSILIIMNNIKEINDAFTDINGKDIVKNCEKKYRANCLTSILYYLNKYMWDNEDKKENSEEELYNKYLNLFDDENFGNKIKCECENIESAENLLIKIYSKINEELTSVNKKADIYSNAMHPIFSGYYKNFQNYNNSLISENFIGHFVITSFCTFCINNPNYIQTHRYQPFYNLIFNLNKIYKYYQINDNNKTKFNLMYCFEYSFIHKYNNIFSRKKCDLCSRHSFIQQLYISILPNILTILFTEYNYNFELQETLEFGGNNKYENNPLNLKGVKKYHITSILYKIIEKNEFICYCLNPNDGFWYSYSSGKVSKVDKIGNNAVPFIAIYHIVNKDNKFIYNKKFDINNVYVKVSLRFGGEFHLSFNRKTDIKTIIEYISKCENSNIQYMLLNAQKVDENKTLEDLLKTNQYLSFIAETNK